MHFIFIIKRQQCLKGCHYIRYSFVLYHFCLGFCLSLAYGNNQLMEWDYWLYLLTETGSVPYALITCGVFVFTFSVFFLKTVNSGLWAWL